MTNLVAMRSVIVIFDTVDLIDRCWERFGAGAEGSDIRSHQRTYYIRQYKAIAESLVQNMFTVVDPGNTIFISKDFQEIVQEVVVGWTLEDTDLDTDFKPVAVFIMRQLIKLFVRKGLTTIDLTHMRFIKWFGNDMVVRMMVAR